MNVIWIVADTFRRDHLGAYGNPWIHTPSLDALAARSIRFDRHYISAFPTMPTRADHQTGRWTMSFMQWDSMPPGVQTLPQMLARAGYHTAASVDTPFYLRNAMNYDRGFNSFFRHDGQLPAKPPKPPAMARHESSDRRRKWRTESDRCAPQTMTAAGEWLELHYEEDFFLLVDTWDPHEPWDAPDYYTKLYLPDYDGNSIYPIYGRWQDRPGFTRAMVDKAHAQYCGEVTMVDTWIGYLLRKVENMGIADKTAIIFTTDHGYYFGEHDGIFGKKVLGKRADGTLQDFGAPDNTWDHSPLYEEVTAIPLLVSVPGVGGGNYCGVTSAVDVMPTVLDLLGQPIPEWVDGRSLLPAINASGTPGREYTISSEPFANPGDEVRSVDDRRRVLYRGQATTISTDRYSLIYSIEPGRSELYDLSCDPHQANNIIHTNLGLAHELHGTLLQFMAETNVPERLVETRRELRV